MKTTLLFLFILSTLVSCGRAPYKSSRGTPYFNEEWRRYDDKDYPKLKQEFALLGSMGVKLQVNFTIQENYDAWDCLNGRIVSSNRRWVLSFNNYRVIKCKASGKNDGKGNVTIEINDIREDQKATFEY